MRDVYTANSSLGDPNSVNKQLETIGRRIDSLRLELNTYQVSEGLPVPVIDFKVSVSSYYHCSFLKALKNVARCMREGSYSYMPLAQWRLY